LSILKQLNELNVPFLFKNCCSHICKGWNARVKYRNTPTAVNCRRKEPTTVNCRSYFGS